MFNSHLETSPLTGAAVILSFIFFLFVPVKLIQIICLGIIFIILSSFLYAKILMRNIKVSRTMKEIKLTCKEQAFISFTIANHSRLPAFTCYYHDEAPFLYVFGDKNSGLTDLRPGELKVISYKLSAPERGLYTLGPVRIRTSDPLGLFTIDFKVNVEMKIMVRPERIKLITDAIPGYPQGILKIQNPVYEDITMRRSIREYQNGDEQKRINWRASARFDRLFTNQYEASFDAPFFVFLNLSEADYPVQSRSYYTEKAIQLAAAIVEKSRFLKQRCGFAAFGSDYPYIKPVLNQADAILDILSLIKTVPEKLDYNPEQRFKHQLPSGTLIFVVGPEEVRKYYMKVENSVQYINTVNTGILRKGVL